MLSTHHKDFCSLSHDFHSLNLNRLQHLQVFGDRTPRNERTNPSVDANGAFLLGRELLRQRQQQTSPWSPSHGRPPHIFIEEGGATATFFAHQAKEVQSSTDAKLEAKFWRHVVIRLQTIEPRHRKTSAIKQTENHALPKTEVFVAFASRRVQTS